MSNALGTDQVVVNCDSYNVTKARALTSLASHSVSGNLEDPTETAS